MLPAERQSCSLLLCLQDHYLGRFKGCGNRTARASFGCFEQEPRPVALGHAQNTEVPCTSGLHTLELCCLERNKCCFSLGEQVHTFCH